MTPPPFTIVVGSGRSGTTLVRAILDSHPELAVSHEAQVLTALAPRRDSYVDGGRLAIDRLIADLYANVQFRQVGLPESDARAALHAAAPRDFADAMRAVFAAFARQHGKARYGDKTPGYIIRIPLLASLFPEARFVHVIRDGRDSALAYVDRAYGPRDIGEAAIRWARRVERGRAAGLALGPERYLEVRYEALVADPEATVRPVCAFLDLPYDEGMLRYYERADDLLAATRNPRNFEHLASPPTAGLRDWRTQMTPADVALFEALAGRTLTALGYDLTTAPTGGLRVRAAVRRLAWQRRRAVAYLRGRRAQSANE